jgi:peroxiredoxin
MHHRAESFVLALAIVSCAHADTDEDLRAGLDLALPDLRGELVRPSPKSDGDVFVLAFWATWCQPCQQELSQMNAMVERFAPRGLQIYAISIDGPDTQAQIAPWVEREGYRFPVLVDRETQVLTRYNPRGDIPYYVVLDARGRVVSDHQGYMAGDVDALAQVLERTLPPGG